jgi:uncharacterized protein
MRDAQFIAGKMGVNGSELDLLRVSISLHDYGFVWSHENHEERGCAAARDILPSFGYTEDEINQVCGMIMATKIPQSPKTVLEQIICDADLFYLGTPYYFQVSLLFEKELTQLGLLHGREEWMNIQTRFLESHSYHTQVAKELLEEQKQKILKILKNVN